MTTNETLERMVRAHPVVAVGGALAAGAVAGLLAAGGKDRGRVSRAVSAALSAVLVSLVRELVVGGARSWIDQRDRETATSYEPQVESFFEH